MKKLYIADWHYDHANILHFDNRPFKTVEEMNAALIERWNAAVDPGDHVYVLGDMFWCNQTTAVEVLKHLNGDKHLIQGNHDKVHDRRFASQFVTIKDYDEIEDGENHIVLSHYPIPCFKNHFYRWYHFYGHVHISFEWHMMEHDKFLIQELYQKPCEMYNVGAMMEWMDYTPRTFEEIVNGCTLPNGEEEVNA